MILSAHRARLLCLVLAILSAAFLAAWARHLAGYDTTAGPGWKPQACPA
jgi:hypothetical protein